MYVISVEPAPWDADFETQVVAIVTSKSDALDIKRSISKIDFHNVRVEEK